jgi:dipeptidyl aminopeptidase/acylaminoacyl peptidase
MNKRMISIMLGVLALAVLVGGAVLLSQAQGALPGPRVSPLRTLSPLQTPTVYVEPTAPSEDWPTLTPPPTWPPLPTPQGTPVVKPGETPTPAPTRPPLPLTPIPEGQPPDDLSGLYYVADNAGVPELRALGMDAQGRRWSESQLALDRFPANLTGLHLSPDGEYLALEFLGDGYGEVSIMERSSGRVWCPLLDAPRGCWGGFSGWTPDNHFLFQPFDVPPEGVISLGVIVVDVATGQYRPLDLPVSPDGVYSLARNVSVSPDGTVIAYSITDSRDGESTSEIWTMRVDSTEKRLSHRVSGLITALLWSPVGEQVIYVRSEPSQPELGELWLMNVDGSDARLLAVDLARAGQLHFSPAWSPDGRYVAFVQLDQPITFDGTYVILAWSNVCVVDTVTGQITRLSSFERRQANHPTWSPDGRFVAFVSTGRLGEETLYGEVWVASADGSLLYPVSGMAKPYNALAWLPSPFSTAGGE